MNHDKNSYEKVAQNCSEYKPCNGSCKNASNEIANMKNSSNAANNAKNSSNAANCGKNSTNASNSTNNSSVVSCKNCEHFTNNHCNLDLYDKIAEKHNF